MRLDELKSETVSSLDMKLSYLTSNKPSYDQPCDDIIKWTLLNSPENYSCPSQFTKHQSSMTLNGDTLLQIQKLWDAIVSDF